MPLHWQPVGPHPPATYWRRRAAVALAALLVLALAWPVLFGGGEETLDGSGPAATPSTATPPAAASPADPTAGPSASASPVDACAAGSLEVTAAADAARYPVGATAQLQLTVRNTGATPCRAVLGQGAVELLVTSGEDRIWSSDDCDPGGEQEDVVLAPGAEETARASWPTSRSLPGCPAGQPQALPGTYRVTGRVGEVRSPGDSFTVG